MGSVPAAEGVRVEAALAEWRRRAVHAYLIANAVFYLVPTVLLVIVHLRPSSASVQLLFVMTFLIFVVAVCWRRLDNRVLIWTTLAGLYISCIVAAVAFPRGPVQRAVPVALPIIALVLLGPRSGRIAVLLSVPVLLFGPFLGAVPGLTAALSGAPAGPVDPAGMVLGQNATLTAMLLVLMLLIERFYQFLIETLAAQSRATAVAKQEMSERRRLEREIARIGDEERRRLGQDVHDGVCQQLTGALLRCKALEGRLGKGGALAQQDVNALSSLLEESLDEAHSVAKGLWPLDAEPDALVLALQALARRTQRATAIRCEFTAAGNVLVEEPATARHLYRIAQEALSNASRHSQASRIVMELIGEERELLLQAEDNGVGLPEKGANGGMGMHTMASRAQIIDGELTVTSAPGQGTRIACRVPRGSRPLLDERPEGPGKRGANG
jgi:signal transduction histidine kinase